MSSDCVFCKIAAGEIPSDVVMSDDHFVAFRDLHPLAPVHVLIVPRRHVTSLDAVEDMTPEATAGLLRFIAAVARQEGVNETGYRVLSNTGPDAGQEVFHMHWHLIGGRRLGGMA